MTYKLKSLIRTKLVTEQESILTEINEILVGFKLDVQYEKRNKFTLTNLTETKEYNSKEDIIKFEKINE